MTLREYAKQVSTVRDLQRRYFVTARKGLPGRELLLEESKKAEKALDETTKEIMNGSVLEQSPLF